MRPDSLRQVAAALGRTQRTAWATGTQIDFDDQEDPVSLTLDAVARHCAETLR